MNDQKANSAAGNTTTSFTTNTYLPACRCTDVAMDHRYNFMSMTFKCEMHGEVTIDRRIATATYPQPFWLQPPRPLIVPLPSWQDNPNYQTTCEQTKQNCGGEGLI